MVRESWRKTGRCRWWWRYRKNLGTKILPRYGRVHVDCRARLAWRPSRSSRRRHTTQRHRQQRWLRERPEEKQIVAVICEVRETILFAKKYCHGTVGFVSICKTHTLTVSAPRLRWCTQRPGADSADQLFTVDLQLCKSALDCTSRLNSWDWVLVQVHLASSVPLWATIRMPTTIAIRRKRSFTISADKTVVVARTLGACAVFFLVIATTTRLLWASFGATLGQVRRRSKPVQAFFLYLLERLPLDLRKGDFRFWSYAWNNQEVGGEQGAFLQILASFCVSQWRKWQFWRTPPATVAPKTRDASRHWKWIFLFSSPRRTGRRF